MINLYHGDCLKIMNKLIAQGVKVDAVVTDPPYGTTACKWDKIIPFDEMWKRLKLLRKDNTPIVLFGTEPFSSFLRLSNIKEYKYDIIWKKSKAGNSLSAKYQPLKLHENISIFYKNFGTYNPQMRKGEPYKRFLNIKEDHKNNHKWGLKKIEVFNEGLRFPISVQDFPQKWRKQDQIHPTQKPVELMEYLIKTYTNEEDTVLDFTMGSGTTGVACRNLNRNFIGIELDFNYYMTAWERIYDARA